jgi:hypothetical protein
MLRRRYEILLPLQYNDGTPIPIEDLNHTREELLAHFGGISVQPGTISGVWIHEGMRYEDSLVRILVDVEDSPENRQFFAEWKPTLLQRFRQIEIYITSFVIDVI